MYENGRARLMEVHPFVSCSHVGEVWKSAPLLRDVLDVETVCGLLSSRATPAHVFIGPHRAMMVPRGVHRAVLRGNSGHYSLKTPPISAHQGKSPCIWGYQAQRPEKARNTFLAGQKGLLINGSAFGNDWSNVIITKEDFVCKH